MSIKLVLDGTPVIPKFTTFSDGGMNVNIGGIVPERSAHMMLSPRTNVSEALWEILLVYSAVMHNMDVTDYITNKVKLSIYIPYLPHARADRVFNKGDGLPLYAFLSAINNMFDEIIIEDVHNKEAIYRHFPGLSEKISHVEQHVLFFHKLGNTVDQITLIVSPDAGARSKVEKLMVAIKCNNRLVAGSICAYKERDLSTGQITSIEVDDVEKAKGRHCIIVDDICDGGGTFIPIAQKLKEAGAASVTLFVSHGIFAKGLKIFRPYIDQIQCYNFIGTYVNHVDVMAYNNGEEVK